MAQLVDLITSIQKEIKYLCKTKTIMTKLNGLHRAIVVHTHFKCDELPTVGYLVMIPLGDIIDTRDITNVLPVHCATT